MAILATCPLGGHLYSAYSQKNHVVIRNSYSFIRKKTFSNIRKVSFQIGGNAGVNGISDKLSKDKKKENISTTAHAVEQEGC